LCFSVFFLIPGATFRNTVFFCVFLEYLDPLSETLCSFVFFRILDQLSEKLCSIVFF
jgi:hypothetical protein